jgi:hypothetical protein
LLPIFLSILKSIFECGTKVESLLWVGISREMQTLVRRMKETVGLTYPEKYQARIDYLKKYGQEEIEKVIHDILTKPQHVMDFPGKIMISEAILQAQQEECNFIQFEAPLLTFPRATPQQWNGNIDHIDTITGEYTIFTGKEYENHNLRLNKKFKGGPQIVPALQEALGGNFKVTMRIDANATPSSRFIVIFPYA